MKEIVITNPNGITLPTKKTLVDDDIKIKIDKNLLGVKPSGKIEITTTEEIDVSSYETAQVVDENLEPQNIAKDVTILGVTGTLESGGGSEDTSLEDGLIEKTLTSYSNDRITKIGEYAFSYSRDLQHINLPNATSMARSAFSYCSSLLTIRLAKLNSINGNGIIQACNVLTDIYFGYEGVVNLSSTGGFSSAPNGIKIHVRSEYADQYATATNWSSLIASGTIVIVGDYSD